MVQIKYLKIFHLLFENITIDTSELNKDNDSERIVYGTASEWDLVEIPHSGIFVSLVGATIANFSARNTYILSAAVHNGLLATYASGSIIANAKVDNSNYISATDMGGLIHTIYSGTFIYEATFDAYIDITNYLNLRKLTPHDFAMKIIRDVLKETGITATAGIGTKMLLLV